MMKSRTLLLQVVLFCVIFVLPLVYPVRAWPNQLKPCHKVPGSEKKIVIGSIIFNGTVITGSDDFQEDFSDTLTNNATRYGLAQTERSVKPFFCVGEGEAEAPKGLELYIKRKVLLEIWGKIGHHKIEHRNRNIARMNYAIIPPMYLFNKEKHKEEKKKTIRFNSRSSKVGTPITRKYHNQQENFFEKPDLIGVELQEMFVFLGLGIATNHLRDNEYDMAWSKFLHAYKEVSGLLKAENIINETAYCAPLSYISAGMDAILDRTKKDNDYSGNLSGNKNRGDMNRALGDIKEKIKKKKCL